jgi:hypothetical protein
VKDGEVWNVASGIDLAASLRGCVLIRTWIWEEKEIGGGASEA